jgi:hypothetical protein
VWLVALAKESVQSNALLDFFGCGVLDGMFGSSSKTCLRASSRVMSFTAQRDFRPEQLRPGVSRFKGTVPRGASPIGDRKGHFSRILITSGRFISFPLTFLSNSDRISDKILLEVRRKCLRKSI